MTVQKITRKAAQPSLPVPAGDRETTAKASARRDLVVAEPAAAVTRKQAADRPAAPRSRLTDALFVAHLFATQFKAPQTREKRRAEPADADASYRKAAQAEAARPSRLLSRKV